MRIKLLVLTTLFLFFGVRSVFAASVVINEIMYDLEGSDSDREWIELLNTGEEIDLANWRFEEDGTQHTLILKQGSVIFPNGQYAVIVDDYNRFLQDYPNFSGTVFDSSFSLSNIGEILKVRDTANGNIIGEVIYSSGQGAAGDGSSLQRTTDGSWLAGLPTPGTQNTFTSLPTSTHSPSPSSTPAPTPKQTSVPTPKKTAAPSPSPTSTPAPLPTETSEESAVKVTLASKRDYRIASVAAATSSAAPLASPSSTPFIKSQKQANPLIWLGTISLLLGGTGVGYIYLKTNGKLHFPFRK